MARLRPRQFLEPVQLVRCLGLHRGQHRLEPDRQAGEQDSNQLLFETTWVEPYNHTLSNVTVGNDSLNHEVIHDLAGQDPGADLPAVGGDQLRDQRPALLGGVGLGPDRRDRDYLHEGFYMNTWNELVAHALD
jgi:hypothetical protein